MLIAKKQSVVGATITTSAGDLLVVSGTLGATGIIVYAKNAGTATNAVTISAQPTNDSAHAATATGLGIYNQHGSGRADGTNILVAYLVPDVSTAPTAGVNGQPIITTPYVAVRGAQATAGTTIDIDAYPVFASGAGPGGGMTVGV